MSYTPLDESDATSSRNGGNRGAAVFHAEESSLHSHHHQPATLSPCSSTETLRQELSEPLTGGDQQVSIDEDPFYMFRDDLYRKLERVDEALAEFLRLVYQLNASSSAATLAELKHAKKQVKKQLQRAEATLRDVELTVNVVEQQRESRFAHISATELYERSAFVHTSRERLHRAKEEVQSEAVKAKLIVLGQPEDDDRRRQRTVPQPQPAATIDRNAALAGDTTQARQSLLMEHQDETLEDLGVAVTRVNDMAGNIHEELGQQNKMLTDMEDDLANAEEELGMVMGKLAKFMKTKNQWQLGTILCLSVTVVVLFFMVLYF